MNESVGFADVVLPWVYDAKVVSSWMELDSSALDLERDVATTEESFAIDSGDLVAADDGDLDYSTFSSVEEDFEVEKTGLHESELAGEAFSTGMSGDLASVLDDILSDDDEWDSDNVSLFEDEAPDFIYELDVDEEQAEVLLKVIFQKLNKFQERHSSLPEKMVLGVPQFRTVEAYLQQSNNTSTEQRLPVEEIIVVDGPQIHCVKDGYLMLQEELDGKE